MVTILIFFLMLSVLILVHELGHFFAALKLGVIAEEFGLGLPPRIRRLFAWRGTEFTLNWLPIGGFVRMKGEDADNSEFPARSGYAAGVAGGRIQNSELINRGFFYAQKPWKRAVILLAGVTMNLIFGVAAFTVVYSFLGIPTETEKVIVQAVAPNGPAERAQLESGDVVLELKSQNSNLKTIKTDQFIEAVNQNRGQELTLVLKRKEQQLEVLLTPRLETETPENEGALGVAISNLEFVHYPWWKMPFLAAITGIKEAIGWSVNIITGLGSMVSQLVLHGRLPKDVAGPVGIAYIAGNVARQGWLALVQFAGILSVNLAVVNILPIPALDGGRLLFLGIERLRGRPVSPQKERWAHLIGYGVLIALILLATIQDILRILSS